MTRKRFCKKLMALGASRNEANRQTSMVGPWQSFEEAYPWAAVMFAGGNYGMTVKKVGRVFERFARA